jgi:5-methylcytosine-specific restriction protein A
MPGWQGSTRRDTLPPDWQTIRKRILARDRGRCQWRLDGGVCGEPANQVDHIDHSRRDDHSDGNLRSLCFPHHQRKSSAEGGRAPRRATRYNVKRPVEAHPGLKRQTPPGQ